MSQNILEKSPLPRTARVVALGASNLTRGFQTVVSTARAAWGPDVEVLAALGHGRSYGARSNFLGRTLPGILESGLWQQLERLPPAPTRGLITDVGNDILYGFSAAQTLAWVEDAADRLQRFTDDIVLTDLPLASIRRLSPARFLLFRSILDPRCRLSLAQIAETALQVNEGLAALAAARGLRFLHLKEHWYGIDPIHIRPSLWRNAWHEILDGGAGEIAPGSNSWLEGLRLYLLPSEQQWHLGLERFTPQHGVTLKAGGRVRLF